MVPPAPAPNAQPAPGPYLPPEAPAEPAPPLRRDKLGLALAGGGFRASLFHLGVLRRLAELDLLRYVEVLSTVSGGSIIGALYVLLLKEQIDRSATLTQQQYVAIVNELERTLREGMRRDLRTRLVMNPLGVLRVLLTQDTLGRRMARLYARYLYAEVVARLRPSSGRRGWWHRGRILLYDVRFEPGGGLVAGGIEGYNRRAVEGKGSAVTQLVLNATSLNSGGPFRFTSVELGDARLGLFRHDEIASDLLPRKALLQECSEAELRQALAAAGTGQATIGEMAHDPGTVSLALWWRAGRRDGAATPPGWESVFAFPRLVDILAASDLGDLRRAKLPAWYLRKGPTFSSPVDGGLTEAQHLQDFWEALRGMGVDEALRRQLREALADRPALRDVLLDFVLELYYLRSARVMSPRILADWGRLTLGDAVGASACFPPVFPPLALLGFYDDLYVTRLGLTDGGVYDNVGIHALLEEGCTYIIASDTSGLFDVAQRAAAGRLGMMGRIVSIFMDDVAGAQRDALRERRRVSQAITQAPGAAAALADLEPAYHLRGLAFFHINSPPLGASGVQTRLDRRALADLRTDLDAFGEVEIGALVNHGYDTSDRYVRGYLADSPYARGNPYWQPASDPPVKLASDPARIQKIIEVGRSRLFRSLRLGAPVSWVFTLLFLGALVGTTWRRPLSVRTLILGAAERASRWIDGTLPLPPFYRGWTAHTVGLGKAILAAVLLVVMVRWLWPRLIAALRDEHPRAFRRVAFAVKWARSLAGNLLWLLGGAPVWIALGGAALGWASYLFYCLPFLRATRNRRRGAPDGPDSSRN